MNMVQTKVKYELHRISVSVVTCCGHVNIKFNSSEYSIQLNIIAVTYYFIYMYLTISSTHLIPKHEIENQNDYDN